MLYFFSDCADAKQFLEHKVLEKIPWSMSQLYEPLDP